ncbi:pentapeptide repeat-containing protein [Fibrella aquatilis]|uniref:Pentapeptide repeat-containing protein n=1 Tax=Fibrella aquatilis TaxID=2817059 RepID=A0A939GC18_9BACT|nr:pentapeptide repeat-containing protein [Fibrella aquatilis]MBO0933842.1 pentapeptide repeat-containing protein [Fibrella aquatilis]
MPALRRPTNQFALLLLVMVSMACSTASLTAPTNPAQRVLTQVANKQAVRVENVTFDDDLDFTALTAYPETKSVARVWIEVPLFFSNCTFNGRVVAFRQQGDTTILCHFGRNLTFVNCRFNNDTRFQSVNVVGITSFSQSHFNRSVSFEGAQFGAEAYFDNALFAAEARFQQATFGQMASFWKSVWAGVGYMQGATFRGDAQFNLTDFRSNLDFSLCTTDGLLNFNYAQLQGRGRFDNTRFRRAVDFSKATLGEAYFEEAYFADKALFVGTSCQILSFERFFFLTQHPVLELDKTKQPTILSLAGARVASGHTPMP